MSGSSPGLQKSQKAGRSMLRPYKEMTLLPAFHCQGDGVAAAEAESSDAALEVAASELVEQGDENARAGGADGMADGDCAPIDVDFFGIEFQLARDGDGGDGKGFVELEEVNVFFAIPAGFLEEFVDGVHGGHHDPLGLDAGDGLGDDAGERRLAKLFGDAFAGDDESGGAVVGAGSVAGGDGAVFLERGLELREGFERSVLAGRFIVLDDDGVPLFLRDFDRENLRFEEAGLPGANGFLVALDGEAVLLLARSEEHTSELQSLAYLVCRLLLEKKKK